MDESKQELTEVVEFLKDPGKFTEIGAKILLEKEKIERDEFNALMKKSSP